MTEEKTTRETKAEDYNPRWKGYVLIALTSLINFCSISTVNMEDQLDIESGGWAVSICFGLLSFASSLLILLQDRSQVCMDTFSYSKAKDGKFEGMWLAFMVFSWCIGVGFQTRTGGIAYVANNIYYSAWSSLASCAYTLNKWSAAQDILSWAELTGLSLTLKSWYACWFSSLVVLFTSVDLHTNLQNTSQRDLDDASFGIGLGVVSTIIASFFILVHYNFFDGFEEGGWLELSSSFFLILLWTIGLAVLTQDMGIAATLSGSHCEASILIEKVKSDGETIGETIDAVLAWADSTENCTISYAQQDGTSGEWQYYEMACATVLQKEFGELQLTAGEVETVESNPQFYRNPIPGSNLYFACWFCFLSSLNITLRWKAAQALQFAQTQEERQQKRLEDQDGDNPFSESDEDDDDDF